MPLSQLEAECARGVRFLGYIENERLIGIMGVELVRNVSLIRHAYVAPDYQARGIGKALLLRIVEEQDRQVLVGTWTAATWAIEFYKHHGFRLPSPACQQLLLNSYWCIPKRMADCSVALARPPLSDAQVDALVNQ
jgi:N-acetylglutamate synthase-like GNAT family acetyltransferase